MNGLWKRLTELTITKRLKLPNGRVFDTNRLVSVSAAAVVLNAETHGDKPVVINAAAGCAVTLPASTGSGVEFNLIIGTTITSNTITVKVANATDVMNGFAIQSQDVGATLQMFEAAATDDTITMDGSTRGGIIGDRISLIDMKAGFWAVKVVSAGTGTEATPFSATV